jgi:lipopolysaccharide transport system permease protein
MIFQNSRPQQIENDTVTIIQPRTGWQLINLKELKDYQDLLVYLVWRDIKVLYAQTILGFMWAILQPCIQILIFTIIFGKVAKIQTDGIPYMLFTSVAIIPWTYMSQTMTTSSQSLVIGQNMLGKVYFPRLIFPVVPALAKLVDFAISMLIILIVSLYYQVMPTWNLLLLPLFIGLMIITSASVGIWLSAMAIRFRDVKLAMPFVIKMLMYTAPIVYSASTIGGSYRLVYSLNPIVSVIEGFRSCLLGTPFLWQFILPGAVTAVLMFLSGVFYFKQMERVFVDVI